MLLQQKSAKRIAQATVLGFLSIPLSGFIADMYIPSLPSIAQDLQISESQVQLSLTLFFLSIGISQFFAGSILDSIGRYRPTLIALTFVGLSSILIANTGSIELIYLMRIIQGMAIAVVVVAKRAFFVDLYTGDKLKNYLSYFTIIWSCGPILAPFFGGIIQKYLHWEVNFYFLAAYAFLLLLLELLISAETLKEKRKFELTPIIKQYAEFMKNKSFVMGLLILGFAYSIVMIFNIAGPFVLKNDFHENPFIIGLCTLILGTSWMIGGFVSKYLMHLPLTHKIFTAVCVQTVLVLLLNLFGLVGSHLWIFIAFGFFIHICSGFLYNIYFVQSMLYFPKNPGMVGGLLGSIVYIITSANSWIISNVGTVSSQHDLSLRYLLYCVILLIFCMLAVRILKKAQQAAVLD